MKQSLYLAHGFHFIELLTTVALIGIVTALCLPLYSQYSVQARRMEAANTLSKLAIAMEQFHIEHHNYRDATLAALHVSETIAKNNYRVAIQNATETDYQLIAIPQGKQAEQDVQCASLILQGNTQKSVTGLGKVEECW